MSKNYPRTRRFNANFKCKRTNKVIFKTELDAKMAIARRKNQDKGEQRYYPCMGHFHLTSKK